MALIQSVGSLELLEEIEKVAAARDLTQDILLEVNIGREAAKSGFLPEDILPGAEAALTKAHVRGAGTDDNSAGGRGSGYQFSVFSGSSGTLC